MPFTVQIPEELESSIQALADQRHVTKEKAVIDLLEHGLRAEQASAPILRTPSEALAYWRQLGILLTPQESAQLPDSPEYARQLRVQAETRDRSEP